MLKRLLATLAACLALALPAHAEYLPGFTLLGHGGDTETIVEARVDAEGRAAVVTVLRGTETRAAIPVLTGSLACRPKGSDRAFLFLSKHGSVEWAPDVAWIDADGRVHLLPDNWGWGVVYSLGHRDPTVEEFRESLATAARDRREVNRIASLLAGADRARATSRLLAEERPETSWYVYRSSSLPSRIGVLFESWWHDEDPDQTYREELCIALSSAMPAWSAEERAAFRAAAERLGPGPARRAHVRLLVQEGVVATDADLFAKVHEEATAAPERALAARALALADAGRGEKAILSDLVLERAETATRLLPLLDDQKGEARDRFLDAVDRLADALVATGRKEDHTFFASLVISALEKGGRKPDLARLLALARSPGFAHALDDLQRAAKHDWERTDLRWDALVR